jgi:OmcA/MtrC family decaheme c-type cytochrome
MAKPAGQRMSGVTAARHCIVALVLNKVGVKVMGSIAWNLRCRQGLFIFVMLLVLAGCSGSDGSDGKQGAAGAPGATITSNASELNFVVNSASVNSPLTVNFTVTNEDGNGFTALTDTDLRFDVAKLIPGSNGDPSRWQNYIVRSHNGMQGSQERQRSGYPWGKLDNHGDGTYTYTFATDITNVSCPSPCTDADGKPLDLSYQPTLTTRIGIQQSNRALPMANAIYDFVPAGGDVTTRREIIKTANCNVCHDKITAHGSRFEVKLCVTCHNPGSWVEGTSSNTKVDFKVMIHKIHRGENLPSVVAGGTFAVGSHDFSDIAFPQDIRNCTKCHDGSDPDTPQGDNWQIPNMAACGSCHDDIDFSVDGSPCYPDDTVPACTTIAKTGHPGGVMTDNSECVTCHAVGRIAGSVAEKHMVPGKVERAFFKFNILKICGTDVGSNPACADGSAPTVTFSVEDPSGNTGHGHGKFYDIVQSSSTVDPEFASGANGTVTLDFAWKGVGQQDWTNDQGDLAGAERPSRALSISVGGLSDPPLHDNGDGTYTYTATWNLTATTPMIGTMGVAIEGRGAAKDNTAAYTVSVPVAAPVAYAAVNDASPMPRRQVIDATTKCDRCHDVLSLHGGYRNDNGQLCVFCHNPNNTDVNMRPMTAGLPDGSGSDGKKEESIDFKRLIHGIHAASSSNFDGTDAHGFRNQGLVVFGYGNREHDFSGIRFPGVLSKCHTCHLETDDPIGDGSTTAQYDTYVLADHTADGGANWELPSINGIIGSTVHSYPSADPDINPTTTVTLSDALIDQSDDYKYSPIASVCSACHDSILAESHMTINGAIFGGAGSEQAVQETNIETCAVCHGPGKTADVELVHEQAFANFLGEFIPD